MHTTSASSSQFHIHLPAHSRNRTGYSEFPGHSRLSTRVPRDRPSWPHLARFPRLGDSFSSPFALHSCCSQGVGTDENAPTAEIMMRIQITANQYLRFLGLIGETLIFHCCENKQPRV